MRFVAVCFTVLLTGCSALDGISASVEYDALADATRDCSRRPSEGSSPTNLMISGFINVKNACRVYFDRATRAQQEALIGNKTLDAGQIATIAVLGVTSSPAAAAKAITITAASVVLAKEIINQTVNTYTFNTHLSKVRELTVAAMADFQTKAEASPPQNYCKAYDYVVDYASICSVASMQTLLDQQIAIPSAPVSTTAPVVVQNSPKAGAPPMSRGYGYRVPSASPTPSFVVRAK